MVTKVDGTSYLTETERNLLQCIADGKGTKGSARRCDMNEQKAKRMLSGIYLKLGCSLKDDVVDCRTRACVMAYMNKWIT